VIVHRLRLHPFGCFADKELAFAPGLTVVLGPNEAGKSTFYRALRHALFVPTTLSKPKLAHYVAPYLPAAGGDTIRVDLELEAAGGRWMLRRRWGAGAGSELVLPAGPTLADEAAIQQKLAALLPARPGTFAGVLLTGQSDLAATIDSLEKDRKEALSDLADILRTAVLETGGVSVDQFRALLDGRIQALFSSWDRARGQPKNNRGIDNPWKREVGEILQAWYETERLRAASKGALSWEKELDELAAKLRAVSDAAADRERFVNDRAKAAADARERRTLEAEAARVRMEIDSLTSLGVQWPRALERIRSLEETMASLEGARASLAAERGEAEREEEGRRLREKHGRVVRKRALVEEARAKLAAAPRLERKTLEEIRLASRDLERLQAGLEAGRLSVTIAGRKGVRIVVQEDFAPEREKTLAPGEVDRLHAGGRLRVVHPDMEIEVRSGEADADARVQRTEAARLRLAHLLAASGARDPAEAEMRGSAWESVAADMAAAERALAEELGAEPLAELDARAAALGQVRQGRPLADVAADLASKEVLAGEKRRERDGLRVQTGEWETAHGNLEQIVGRLADARHAEKGMSGRIARCAPLPDGFTDADTFLRAWEAAQGGAQSLRAEESGLRERRVGLEARAPDQSSEELAGVLAQSHAQLQAVLRRGESLQRISRIAGELLGGSDSTVASVMRKDLEKTLSAMTGGYHAGVDMDGALPRGLAGADGARLGRDLLSAGTKDSLALALRLVMARHFLAGTDGFLVMDDPLVDMDPERQQAAAGALRELAAEKQLILFTCHPATATMLGGTLVEL
jgi:exonuclease SbcC